MKSHKRQSRYADLQMFTDPKINSAAIDLLEIHDRIQSWMLVGAIIEFPGMVVPFKAFPGLKNSSDTAQAWVGIGSMFLFGFIGMAIGRQIALHTSNTKSRLQEANAHIDAAIESGVIDALQIADPDRGFVWKLQEPDRTDTGITTDFSITGVLSWRNLIKWTGITTARQTRQDQLPHAV